MKYQISFTLNAKGTSFSIKDHKDDVPGAIQNVTQFLQGLESHFLERKAMLLAEPAINSALQKAQLVTLEEKIKLASQILDHVEITATFANGKSVTWKAGQPLPA